MKLVLQITGAIILAVLLGFLVFQSYDQGGLLEWDQWVNKVQIAGQAGSNEQVVLLMLGKPTSIEDVGKLPKTGVSPRPLPPPQTKKVYVYSRVFPGAGFWLTYVFIGQSGQVLGVHIATS